MHTILEKYKVEVRQIRHEVIEAVKAGKESGDFGEDDAKRRENEMQKVHDEFIASIEELGKTKESQLREV